MFECRPVWHCGDSSLFQGLLGLWCCVLCEVAHSSLGGRRVWRSAFDLLADMSFSSSDAVVRISIVEKRAYVEPFLMMTSDIRSANRLHRLPSCNKMTSLATRTYSQHSFARHTNGQKPPSRTNTHPWLATTALAHLIGHQCY